MHARKDIPFGQFRLDLTNECLWHGTRAIPLRPKAFAVLKLLIDHPGQLVTKQQILDSVWSGTFVSDAVLKDSIRQLREALSDQADSPVYIETAHRRGYRFIGKLSEIVSTGNMENAGPGVAEKAPPTRLIPVRSPEDVLDRESELARMRQWLEHALAGERQVVFVTGEAGIGKTTLVQAFLEQTADVAGIRIARGQCLEHYGAGEPYMPVLDAFSRLGRTEARSQLAESLCRHAPAWLAQMPSLSPPAEREPWQTQMAGATRERMLREMAEALEAFTADDPLILVLEDLHWSDFSTIDLISYLARRRDPARLMVVGTYRPVEVILGEHPLKSVKRELQAHALCNELPLEYLTEKAIAKYLAVRFPGHQFYGRLARIIHRRTEGNPLFMVNVVAYLVDGKLIIQDEGTWKLSADLAQVERGVPENVKQLIEKQIERLSPDERTVLEAASVVGMECSSVAIAAGLDMPTEWVEKHCEELARRHQFLSPAWLVELPDGTITARHRFNHTLYLDVPYSLVPPMRRSQIHHRIAERGVTAYGDQVTEIAAELAMHFEQSRDWPRALEYLLQAADNARAASAHHEAADLARRGLGVVKFLADTPERARQEVKLRMILGVSLMALKGFASAEVEEVYEGGRQLFWLQGPSPELFHMQRSLCLYYVWSAEVASALEISVQLLQLAEDLKEGALIMEAHREVGGALADLGRSTEGLKHLDQATALYDEHRNHRYKAFIGRDCKVVCACFASRALWTLGYPDRAAERMAAGLALAHELGHPESLVIALHFAAQLHQMRGEVPLAYERAKELVELANEYGLELWGAFGNFNLGWAEVEMGQKSGIERMQRGLAAYEATGAKLWRPHFLGLLAIALANDQQLEAALKITIEAIALAEHSGEMHSLAELYRIRGKLLMMGAAANRSARSPESRPQKAIPRDEISSPELAEAERYLTQALVLARQQQAKSWELRSLNALIRLHIIRGSQRETHRLLTDTYAWFKEGHDTMDLKDARIILESAS